MARKVVVLNYGEKGLIPSPEPVPLAPKDSVSFRLGIGPPGAHIKVTWEDSACFSRADFDGNDPRGDISVTAALPGAIHYKCQLFAQGQEVAQPKNAAGGTGVPAGGGSGKGK